MTIMAMLHDDVYTVSLHVYRATAVLYICMHAWQSASHNNNDMARTAMRRLSGLGKGQTVALAGKLLIRSNLHTNK